MQVIKAGGLYFLLTFTAGFIFGTIRVLVFEPNVGKVLAVLMEAPLLICAMVYFSRKVCSWLSIAPILPVRLRLGGFAFLLLILAELTGAFFMHGQTPAQYLQSMTNAQGAIAFMLFVLFGAMPSILSKLGC